MTTRPLKAARRDYFRHDLNVSPVPVKQLMPAGHSLASLQRFVHTRALAEAEPPHSSVSHCA